MRTIYKDNQFTCIQDDLQDKAGIVLIPTASDEHEPYIERNNRTVKERLRCAFSSIPFEHLPQRMIIEMVYAAVFWLNSICPNDGVSTTLSPREIMTGLSLNDAKHMRFQYGEYSMAHKDETDSTMKVRATYSIYLRPSGNMNGGFYVYSLITGQRLHRMHATLQPITQAVIDRIAHFAIEQKAPTGLAFDDDAQGVTLIDLERDPKEDNDDASDKTYDLK